MNNKRWAGAALAAAMACVGMAAASYGATSTGTTSTTATSSGTGTPATGDSPCTPSAKADCMHRLDVKSGTTLPYYATYPLTGSAKPTGAIVVIHGTGRNAEHYFSLTSEAAKQEGDKAEVIAPWFQAKDKGDNPEKTDAYWTNNGDTSWKDGGNAVQPSGLSSFDTIDTILNTLADKKKFPNLKNVTLLGHSAGAQFMQRYAAGGTAPNTIKGLKLHWVVANPSSYVYLDDKRPEKTSGCDEYNDYKYGLDNRYGYLKRLDTKTIIQQYTTREITYLLGEKDTVDNGDMDKKCPAMAQGPNRFSRGENFYKALHAAYPKAPQDLVTVPGVAHDNEKMVNSKQGKEAIFRGW